MGLGRPWGQTKMILRTHWKVTLANNARGTERRQRSCRRLRTECAEKAEWLTGKARPEWTEPATDSHRWSEAADEGLRLA